MKTLSVLIAAYKAERWLEQCIQSVQAQRLPAGVALEILVGVDGCASSLAVAKRLVAGNMKVFYSPENNGPFVTFNTLMRFASGEWICRFDADDVMHPDFLAEQLRRLGGDVNMTLTWSIFTDECLQPTSIILAHDDYRPARGEHRRGGEGCFVLERQVWGRLGGFRPWRCGADTDFRDRVIASGLNISVVEKFLSYRRVHENSLTAHPATNFESDLRKRYIDQLDVHRLAYRKADAEYKIEPVYAEIYEVHDRLSARP